MSECAAARETLAPFVPDTGINLEMGMSQEDFAALVSLASKDRGFQVKPITSKIRTNLTGKKFNRLTVIGFAGEKAKYPGSHWLCKCDCGNYSIIRGCHIPSGGIKSCGCIKKDNNGCRTHGMTDSPTMISYLAMKNRCLNPRQARYKDYGGRGVKITDRWLGKSGFLNFLEDMGQKDKGMTLDRVDNNGGYCKENCRWITLREQSRNKRTNVFYDFMGERLLMDEVLERVGLPGKRFPIKARILKGMTLEQAINDFKKHV